MLQLMRFVECYVCQLNSTQLKFIEKGSQMAKTIQYIKTICRYCYHFTFHVNLAKAAKLWLASAHASLRTFFSIFLLQSLLYRAHSTKVESSITVVTLFSIFRVKI